MCNRKAGTLVYTVFAFRVVYIAQSISTTSIVRLKCNGLNPRIQKCIGTYILPNTLITTSSCADTCQYAEDLPILQKYVHKHYKSYVAVNGVLRKNDIALLTTNATKRKLIQVSFLDHVSPLGLKALVPIMDENQPKLQVAVIQRCVEDCNSLSGYYVCTNRVMTEEAIRVCKVIEEQGTPLLLDDKVYGIMSLRHKDNCIIPQRRFTAIGPALSWISSTSEKLDEEYQTLKMRSEKQIALELEGAAQMSLFTENFTSSAILDSNETLYSSEIETTNKIREMKDIIAYFATKKALDPIHHKFNELKTFAPVVEILRGGNRKPMFTITTTPSVLISLQPNHATAITFRPRLRARSVMKLRQMTSSTQKITTTRVIPFFKDLGNNKTTNVMDWFRNELKREENRPHFLVLNTTIKPKPLFIDLT